MVVVEDAHLSLLLCLTFLDLGVDVLVKIDDSLVREIRSNLDRAVCRREYSDVEILLREPGNIMFPSDNCNSTSARICIIVALGVWELVLK